VEIQDHRKNESSCVIGVVSDQVDPTGNLNRNR
jgi:hypothetical protein